MTVPYRDPGDDHRHAPAVHCPACAGIGDAVAAWTVRLAHTGPDRDPRLPDDILDAWTAARGVSRGLWTLAALSSAMAPGRVRIRADPGGASLPGPMAAALTLANEMWDTALGEDGDSGGGFDAALDAAWALDAAVRRHLVGILAGLLAGQLAEASPVWRRCWELMVAARLDPGPLRLVPAAVSVCQLLAAGRQDDAIDAWDDACRRGAARPMIEAWAHALARLDPDARALPMMVVDDGVMDPHRTQPDEISDEAGRAGLLAVQVVDGLSHRDRQRAADVSETVPEESVPLVGLFLAEWLGQSAGRAAEDERA